MDIREKLVELFYDNNMICDQKIEGLVDDVMGIIVDAVPVVRCKDCKHWHKDTVFCDYMSYGEASERVNWYADDFCSYGERKEDK